MKVGVVPPRWQAIRLEAAVEMGVSPDSIPCFVRAEADERNAQLVAEEAQQIEHPALLAVGTGNQVLDLVDDQHAGRSFLQQPTRRYQRRRDRFRVNLTKAAGL